MSDPQQPDQNGSAPPPTGVAFWKTFELRKTPEQEKIEATLERLARMTPADVHRIAVATGIRHEDGSLTDHYVPER